jgi:hypothetical protein
MKADIIDFRQEITDLRDSYMDSRNKGGARVAQQVLTLAEIYSKYDFSGTEFYTQLHKTIKNFSLIYESYEFQEKEANKAVLDTILQYQAGIREE